MADKNCCAICLQSLCGSSRIGAAIPCGHCFHEDCWSSFLSSSLAARSHPTIKCPLCNDSTSDFCRIFLDLEGTDANHVLVGDRYKEKSRHLEKQVRALQSLLGEQIDEKEYLFNKHEDDKVELAATIRRQKRDYESRLKALNHSMLRAQKNLEEATRRLNEIEKKSAETQKRNEELESSYRRNMKFVVAKMELQSKVLRENRALKKMVSKKDIMIQGLQRTTRQKQEQLEQLERQYFSSAQRARKNIAQVQNKLQDRSKHVRKDSDRTKRSSSLTPRTRSFDSNSPKDYSQSAHFGGTSTKRSKQTRSDKQIVQQLAELRMARSFPAAQLSQPGKRCDAVKRRCNV